MGARSVALLKNGKVVADVWRHVNNDDAIPADGPVIVELPRWKEARAALQKRDAPVGVLLRSDESAETIADDLDVLALVALDFPSFTDGRAYSSARILRERYGYEGELRAVGDVDLEHLLFMHRCGFDAFEIDSDDPERDWQIAEADFSVWYQPTADGRATVNQRRHG